MLRIEVEKTRSAHGISEEGRFRVPQVLEFQEAEGVAVFERIHNAAPLACAPKAIYRDHSLAERLGTVLAHIHTHLTLPQELESSLPPDYDCSTGDRVWLHGDFTGSNILLSVQDQTPIIIDWLTSWRVGETVTTGTPLFDVFWFVRWHYLRPGIIFRHGKPVDEFCLRFITAYLESTHVRVTMKDVGAYMRRVWPVDAGRRNAMSPWRRRVCWLLGDLRLLRLVGRL